MKNFKEKLIKFLQTILEFLKFWDKKEKEDKKQQESSEETKVVSEPKQEETPVASN